MRLLSKFRPAVFTLALAVAGISALPAVADDAHSPAQGSAEREAIGKALLVGKGGSVKFFYIKVHNGWAWVDSTPLDHKGQPVAEGGTSLLHQEQGKWKVIDLSKIPRDPNDPPIDEEEASPGLIRNLVKKYPDLPKDIFPKAHH